MTTVASHRQLTPSDHDEFIALICADQELLRAEFDAIVAAQRPTIRPHRPVPPPHQQSGVPGAERPSVGPTARRSGRHERCWSRPPSLAPVEGPSQRSPPLADF